MKSVRCVVTGRVQGVCFRAWTREQAQRLGLAGWVRNLGDGSVEALAQGPDQAVDDFTARLWQGPGASLVRAVDCTEQDAEPVRDFTIRW